MAQAKKITPQVDPDETNKLLEIIIHQNEQNNPEAVLEAGIIVQKQILDTLGNVQRVDIKGDKGDPGDPGRTPVKGKDYFTDEEIEKFKKEVTPVKGKDYRDGKDGYTPVKGKDYDDGKDGETPDTDAIIKEIISKIPDVKKNIAKEMATVKKEVKKEIEDGLPTWKPAAQSIEVKQNGVPIAGKLESINLIGSGSAIQTDSWGNITINTSVPFSVNLSSQCDGSNKIFTLPEFTSVLLLTIGNSFPGVYNPLADFTILSNTQIEMSSEVSAPQAGQTLIALVI